MNVAPFFSPEDLVGRTLCGRYRIVRPIGRGGMGVVYEAEQIDLRRRVALKLLHDDGARNLARFRQEARTLAALSCPHVVTIFDVHTEDAYPVLTMELLQGESLATRIVRTGPMPAEEAISVARQMLVALEAAHRCGIVHRDVKPSNVFLTDAQGGLFVKLLDFGVAKNADAVARTTTGTLLGTPHYFAPEQIRGQADARTDLHAVGLCLHEMLVGKRAWHAASAPEAVRMALEHVPSLVGVAGVSPELASVVERSLAKDPAARFTDAASMRDALEALGRVPQAPPSEGRARTKAPTFLAAMMGTLLLAALGAFGFALQRRSRAPREASSVVPTVAPVRAPVDASPPALPPEPAEEAVPSASAATPRPPPAKPARQACICHHRLNDRAWIRLCPRLLEPRCDCRAEFGGTMCPEPWSQGRCNATFHGPKLAVGGPCQGYFDEPSSPKVDGTLYRCVQCYGDAAVPGEEGRPCQGYDAYGELRQGEFHACR